MPLLQKLQPIFVVQELWPRAGPRVSLPNTALLQTQFLVPAASAFFTQSEKQDRSHTSLDKLWAYPTKTGFARRHSVFAEQTPARSTIRLLLTFPDRLGMLI